MDVECILCFKAFTCRQDKIDFVEYLFANGLILAKTADRLEEELKEE